MKRVAFGEPVFIISHRSVLQGEFPPTMGAGSISEMVRGIARPARESGGSDMRNLPRLTRNEANLQVSCCGRVNVMIEYAPQREKRLLKAD